MNKHLLRTAVLSCVFCLTSIVCSAQTNVSGGIYANTTWTKVNSPYIVTDTVVVFPGVTLTIEPGVLVKFNDGMVLEIRQANIIAEGTAVDSITFTSNSGSPHLGSWSRVWLNMVNVIDTPTIQFNYCNFRYANNALFENLSLSPHGYTVIYLRNSTLEYNNYGVSSLYRAGIIADSCNFSNNKYGMFRVNGWVTNCNFYNNQIQGLEAEGYCQIINCKALGNQTGIYLQWWGRISNCYVVQNATGIKLDDGVILNTIVDSNTIVGINVTQRGVINKCKLRYNAKAMIVKGGAPTANEISENVIEFNTIGINLTDADSEHIYCNKFCSNTLYDFEYTAGFNSNVSIPNNYWCSTDSATIAPKIYDGYDNVNYGLVSIMPIDTEQCFANHCSASFTLTPDTVPHHYTAVGNVSGVGTINYVWSWGDNTSSTTAYPSHTYSNAGFYTICLSITDSIGCSSYYCNDFSLQRTTNTMVYVNVVPNTLTDISETRISSPAFTIYPNPASNTVTITINETMPGSILTVTDITGKKLTAVQLQSSVFCLPTSNFSNGIYFVTIENEKERTTKKLVIEK